MSLSYAMLLDGGFLRRKLGSAKSPATARKIAAFSQGVQRLPCLAGMRLHRIYYYDAKPLDSVVSVPLGGGQRDFSASGLASQNRSIQSELPREPFFALRFGELSHDGWHLKPRIQNRSGPTVQISAADFQPTIRQKGVDMRIGLDIASLTLKRQANVIVLVTADSDFIPAMKFARREGAQLFLVTLGHGVREGMREHADLVIDSKPETEVPLEIDPAP
jgi:uncharacterized LabA/DUF88 family protein